MDMKALLADFIDYVNNMSDEDVRNSIEQAVRHTKNSHILDGGLEEEVFAASYTESEITVPSTDVYAFSSIPSDDANQKYNWGDVGRFAA